MTITPNLFLNSRSDMIAAIRAMQIELAQPVCSSVDDQNIGREITKLQKYLSTQPYAGYPSGFIYDPAKIKNNLTDQSLPGAVVELQILIVGASSPATPTWLGDADIGLNYTLPEASCGYVRGVGVVSFSTLVTLAAISNQTVLDSAGNLTAVANNSPALSDTGLQTTWEGRQNKLLWPADVSNPAAWLSFASGTGSVVVTGNQGIARDGTNSLTKVTINRADTSSFAQRYQVFAGTAAAWSGSFDIKAFSAGDVGKQISLAFSNGSVQVGVLTIVLTATLKRYEIPNVTLAASASCQIISGYFPAAGATVQTGAVNYLIGFAQAELGATVSPYIPNAGTVLTRAAADLTAAGALATLLARPTASAAIWINSSDRNDVAKTLIDANGTVLLGVNSSRKAVSAVGAPLASSNEGAWTGVNNLGFAWDASGGLTRLIDVSTSDATARTPSGPFKLFSTGGASNFWNGNIGGMLFWNTKKSAPQVVLPSGVTPGFINRYTGSPLPGTAQYRDFRGMKEYNGGSPIFTQNSGAYNATGTNTPYLRSSVKVGGSYYALTEGAIAGQSDRNHQWRNINLYIGSDPVTWTPHASNPVITATIGGDDDYWTLHPAISMDFAANAFTAFYSARNFSDNNWRVFRATSPTGLPGTWTKQGRAIDGNAGAGYANPGLVSLMALGSTVYMFLSSDGNTGTKILVFTSPKSGDGSSWTYQGVALDTPVLGDWDYGAANVLDVFVYPNRQGWIEMHHTSNVNGVQFMGYAVSSHPLTPFVRAPEYLQAAKHLQYAGDPAFDVVDGDKAYYLFCEDNGGYPSGTAQAYASTLPPY